MQAGTCELRFVCSSGFLVCREKGPALAAVVIETSLLNSQHLLRHAPRNEPVWYEVITPFIQRVGLETGAKLGFSSRVLMEAEVQAKRFDYVVIGDARTVDGLATPFNEKETDHIVKFEQLHKEPGLLRFWFKHANTDLYSEMNVEVAQLEDALNSSTYRSQANDSERQSGVGLD
jgi:hypothetical protein